MTRFVYVLPAGRFRWEMRVDLGDLDLSNLAAVARAATPGPWVKNDEDFTESIFAADGYTHVLSGGKWGGEAPIFDRQEDAEFIATFDPPTVLELLNLIETEPQFYRLKRDALIAARAIAIIIGGEVQPHNRRGRIQDPDSFGNDPERSAG